MTKSFSIVFILFTICSFAQFKESSYSFNANYGASVTPSAITNSSGQHVGLGLTYMSSEIFGMKDNEVFGFKLGFDFDRYDFGQVVTDQTSNFMRGSAELVCNLSNAITPQRFRYHDEFNVIAHAGLGLGVNKPIVVTTTEDGESKYEFGAADKIGHIIIGLTPKYEISKDIAINVDGSAIFNFSQQINSDGTSLDGKAANTMFTVSAGLIYTIQ